jgi:uncharacterized membrane protein
MEMKNRKNNHRKRLSFAGAGLALGAAFGILFGMLLFENPWYGPILGAAAGLLFAALIDINRNRNDRS